MFLILIIRIFFGKRCAAFKTDPDLEFNLFKNCLIDDEKIAKSFSAYLVLIGAIGVGYEARINNHETRFILGVNTFGAYKS